MYTPTEQELLDLNFTYDDTVWFQMSLYPFMTYSPDHTSKDNTHWHFHWPFYPRSREHLEQIILAFKP